jgi:hypothetical protein
MCEPVLVTESVIYLAQAVWRYQNFEEVDFFLLLLFVMLLF